MEVAPLITHTSVGTEVLTRYTHVPFNSTLTKWSGITPCDTKLYNPGMLVNTHTHIHMQTDTPSPSLCVYSSCHTISCLLSTSLWKPHSSVPFFHSFLPLYLAQLQFITGSISERWQTVGSHWEHSEYFKIKVLGLIRVELMPFEGESHKTCR